MFERNNIDDLFLASISVLYPDDDKVTDNVGNFFSLNIFIDYLFSQPSSGSSR